MTIELNYTPQESLDLIRDVHGDRWNEQINRAYRVISGVAVCNRLSLEAAYKRCVVLSSEMSEKMRYAAGYAFLRNPKLIKERIQNIDHELQGLARRSAFVEDSSISQKEKSFTRTAVRNKASVLDLEKKQLLDAKNNLSNLPVKAVVITPNGSSIRFDPPG